MAETSQPIPKFKKAADVKISIDLIKASKYQLDFLKEVNLNKNLYGGPVVKNAIHRYEQMWLPLIAQWKKSAALIPPLDVHWIWHCHMLAPCAYRADCISIVGKVIDHKLVSDKKKKKLKKFTQKVWHSKYPNEPYNIDISMGEMSEINYNSQCEYDIEAAVGRQKVFYYQVSLPHFKDKIFLQAALTRYKKQLFLKKHNPEAFLVPCYDIDIIWHSHQLHPVKYNKDTVRIIGRIYNHNDSVNDRSPESQLNKSFAMSKMLWERYFSEELGCHGAMYRGDPSDSEFTNLVVQPPTPAQFHAALKKGEFIHYTGDTVPPNVWKPVPVHYKSQEILDECVIAKHSFRYNAVTDEFSCVVMHSTSGMSAVKVYFRDQLVALSHTISSVHLPTPKQVKLASLTPVLDQSEKELGMIIKDENGDWAILVAKWTGVVKGIPGIAPGIGHAVKGILGEPGHFELVMYDLRNDKKPIHRIRLPELKKRRVFYLPANKKIKLDQFAVKIAGKMTLSLSSGRIVLSPENKELAQTTCLAMSIAVLEMLCKPPAIQKTESKRGDAAIKYATVDTEHLPVILAAGSGQREFIPLPFISDTDDGAGCGGCGGCGCYCW